MSTLCCANQVAGINSSRRAGQFKPKRIVIAVWKPQCLIKNEVFLRLGSRQLRTYRHPQALFCSKRKSILRCSHSLLKLRVFRSQICRDIKSCTWKLKHCKFFLCSTHYVIGNSLVLANTLYAIHISCPLPENTCSPS